jgi:hypothetical protein
LTRLSVNGKRLTVADRPNLGLKSFVWALLWQKIPSIWFQLVIPNEVVSENLINCHKNQ